ncbi:hypothetical protein QCD83_27005 [Pseudomonas savastanoi pv. phaseolicola]|uniref:Uncharacterized protein n=4 Tax=Pseudomonas savastanoi TaxID=29438 RepID=A0A3M4Y8K8_PSESG|nr:MULTISPECIES: hypothetical protein [Pseudomonas]AAZ36381.1 conserved hypothetical protein [Pseudomonas savastanoi pv. phaseolicola 1448A]EFW83455.1 hypothetical protein PsgRace4_24581 [Pseudomonas savastanoi pv. glycinea str. race 4]EGH11489.1 hypothetical protein Pgy4_10905 [Pseudomonas savastanoi pv. glycinea str. race 4]KPB39114.1 Uncharacterized protein AC515_2321 [Pseudomonas savastanoi pv. phaseolicola]KPB44577.1 Uncharacterized protein AC513_2878 [Pseudomonas savastanoi pv. phaseolic
MRVISSGIEALVTARQLDEKIASKKIPILASSSSRPDFLDPSVTISGGAILKQRIFGLTDPKFPAPMLGKAECGTSMPETSFLTRDDRRLLGEVYEWARDQGADLFYVDDLAFGLASYREKDDGRIWSRHNEGKTYDMEGHKVFYSFTDTNAATAKRIIEGSALTTTRLDQGFIRFITDKDYGALGHNHFEFMEKVINRFSTSGERDQQLGPDYATYKSQKNDYIRTLSKEKYAPGEGDIRETGIPAQKTAKPKEITLESLREDMRNSFMKAMGIKNFSSLFDVLFKNRR